MNTFEYIKKTYNIDTLDAARILNVSEGSVYRYNKKKISELTVEQLVLLHDHTKADYNTLLGEDIFSFNNIMPKRNNITNSIYLIDEPESNLHPADIRVIQKIIDEKLKSKKK